MFFIIFWASTATAQVVNLEKLKNNYEESYSSTTNYPNKTIDHKWIFESNDDKITFYKLELAVGNKSSIFDVQIRNLISTTYITVRLINKKNELKSLSAIYDTVSYTHLTLPTTPYV